MKIPTANVILNDRRLNAFPLRSGIRQGYILSSLFFDYTVLKVLATAMKRRKKKQRQTDRKE